MKLTLQLVWFCYQGKLHIWLLYLKQSYLFEPCVFINCWSSKNHERKGKEAMRLLFHSRLLDMR